MIFLFYHLLLLILAATAVSAAMQRATVLLITANRFQMTGLLFWCWWFMTLIALIWHVGHVSGQMRKVCFALVTTSLAISSLISIICRKSIEIDGITIVFNGGHYFILSARRMCDKSRLEIYDIRCFTTQAKCNSRFMPILYQVT